MKNRSPAAIATILLAALAFAMPIVQRQLSILIGLALFSTLFAWNFKLWRTSEFWIKVPFFFTIAFYLWHAVGLLWSDDVGFGAFDLQVKMSFVVFPLALFFFTDRTFRFRQTILKWFVFGNALASVLCILYATYRYTFIAHNTGYFVDRPFSIFLHLGYFSIYLAFCVAAVYFIKPSIQFKKRAHEILWWLCIPLFVITIFLTVSKMGMIVLTMTFGFILFDLFKTRGRKRAAFYMFGGIIIAGIIYFSVSSYARYRIHRAVEAAEIDRINPNAKESSMERLMTWDSAWHLFLANPWIGVGTGDIKDDLVAYYKAHNYTKPYNERLNAHCQYLQSAAALGIVGFILLMGMFISGLYRAIKTGDRLLLIFTLSMMLACATESFLERQGGVVYFCFFYFVLINTNFQYDPILASKNR